MRLPRLPLVDLTVVSALVFLVTELMKPARSKAAPDLWTSWDIVGWVSGGIVVLGLSIAVIADSMRWVRKGVMNNETPPPRKES